MIRTATAADVVALARERPPTLDRARLICVDGPAGSGKTTLAAGIAELTGAPVVHLDDVYPGWDGLTRIEKPVTTLLAELAEGRPGRYRRYDWYAGAYAEECVVEPTPLIVLDGVGAYHRAWAEWITVLVWVEAAPEVRRERGLARGGVGVTEHWDAWTRQEDALHRAEGTRERADLVLTT